MTVMLNKLRAMTLAVGLATVGLTACESSEAVDSDELSGASEQGEQLTKTVPAGAVVRSTTGINLRLWPANYSKIQRVVPQGARLVLVTGVPKDGWYKVTHDGLTGWVFGQNIDLVDEGDGDGDPDSEGEEPTPASKPATSTRDAAINRAKSVVGYSYWWGHGRWSPSGVSKNAPAGSCSGSCPNCGHSGSWGADCSGFAAKVWQVPSTNTDLTKDSHPYTTVQFSRSSSLWSIINRSDLKKADALSYNTNGAGHIVIYSSGDAWGAMNAYECKGCAAGCVYNLRTIASSYKPIRRAGW